MIIEKLAAVFCSYIYFKADHNFVTISHLVALKFKRNFNVYN